MKVIPDFISSTAKEYYASDTFAGVSALGWIIYNNMLDVPAGDRALSVCTMVYEK